VNIVSMHAPRLVGDLMALEPIVVRADMPLTEAAILMDRHQVSGLPVVDGGGTLVGVISDTDLLRARATEYLWANWPGLRVKHLMTSPALTSRRDDFSHYAQVLIPFFVSRQIYSGAGKVLQTARGAMFCLSQRAEHIWEGVSSATTRSRPIINTRDEPHADAERFRRLHVIVGDSNMSEYATYLKVGATSILLRMLEDPGVVIRDLTLEDPIRAIREISHDITCRREVRLANGRELSALDIQREYLDRALRYHERRGLPDLEERALGMWKHCVEGIEKDPLSLDRECDWVIKHRIVEAYRERHQLPLGHPKVALVDLQYHDVDRSRGIFYLLQAKGQVERITTDEAISQAMETPPATTRARLRGEFIKRAKEKRRDFTVDWVHLKLNDQTQRTVLLKDPFRSHDERVERLIESI